MKKAIYLLLIIWCGAIAVGCSDDENPTEVLSIVKADVNISAAGGQADIEYQSSLPVQVSVSDEWCKVSDNSNGVIRLEVEPNTGYPGRSTLVQITSGTEEQTLTLTQAGAVFVYDESKLVQHVGDAGGTVATGVYGSFPTEAEIADSDKDWISYVAAEDGKGGSFVVKPNDTGDKRAARITLKSGERSCTYTIFQYDVESLLGTYSGQYQSYLDGKTYGLKNVEISKSDEEGVYLINGLLGASTNLPIKATYSNGSFSIAAGQQFPVSIAGRDYVMVLALMNQNEQSGSGSQYTVGLSPMYIEGPQGNFALNFTDNGGLPGTFAGLHFIIYYNGTSLGAYEVMVKTLLYRI